MLILISFKSGTPIYLQIVEQVKAAASSGALYLQVTYLDRGYGRLNVAYLGGDGQMNKPDKFTQAVLSDSGKWMTS